MGLLVLSFARAHSILRYISIDVIKHQMAMTQLHDEIRGWFLNTVSACVCGYMYTLF